MESRPGVVHLKIPGIFHIFHTSYKTHETGKNCQEIFILVIFWFLFSGHQKWLQIEKSEVVASLKIT